MSDSRLIGLAAGLLCVCGMTADGYAAGEVRPAVPNFSSIDRPGRGSAQETACVRHRTGHIRPCASHHGEQSEQCWYCRGSAAAHRGREQSEPKPWVVDALKRANDELLAGDYVDLPGKLYAGFGVPQFLLYAGGAESIYVSQTPKEIVMIHQADNQTRHIYMDVPHSAHPSPSWYGESVGHFDGDELVVDTMSLNDRTFLDDRYSVPHTTQLHVIERFKLMDEGRILQVTFTVEDPGAFNAPWSAVVRYQHARAPTALFEEPCAENNNENLSSFVHSPVATKADF